MNTPLPVDPDPPESPKPLVQINLDVHLPDPTEESLGYERPVVTPHASITRTKRTPRATKTNEPSNEDLMLMSSSFTRHKEIPAFLDDYASQENKFSFQRSKTVHSKSARKMNLQTASKVDMAAFFPDKPEDKSKLPDVSKNSNPGNLYFDSTFYRMYTKLINKKKVLVSHPYDLPYAENMSQKSTQSTSPYEIHSEFRSPRKSVRFHSSEKYFYVPSRYTNFNKELYMYRHELLRYPNEEWKKTGFDELRLSLPPPTPTHTMSVNPTDFRAEAGDSILKRSLTARKSKAPTALPKRRNSQLQISEELLSYYTRLSDVNMPANNSGQTSYRTAGNWNTSNSTISPRKHSSDKRLHVYSQVQLPTSRRAVFNPPKTAPIFNTKQQSYQTVVLQS